MTMPFRFRFSRRRKFTAGLSLLAAFALQASSPAATPPTPAPNPTPPADVYATYGVHSDAHADDCKYPTCVYERKKDEPTNPTYPPYWTSHWAMYRVYNKYQAYPPPYAKAPAKPLKEGQDYQKSWGATYYDSTLKTPWGVGAMEEHYKDFCLPIFPIDNNYTCSFISLGQTAFFVAGKGKPDWMPDVCLFSPNNAPPARDFIKHLPYSKDDSARLRNTVQGYSFWVGSDNKPAQVGVSPDETDKGWVMFGYGFDAKATPDRIHKSEVYRHPQSFYFSGVPYMKDLPKPDAPIVSQNYTDFAMLKPHRKEWTKLAKLDPTSLPPCQLFTPPQPAPTALGASPKPRTWADLGKH